MTEVVVVPRDQAIEDFPREESVKRHLLNTAESPNREARATAPYRTGAGAASIRADALIQAAGWEVRSTWDRDHYYMYFQHEGWEHYQGRPFLVSAWEGAGV
jgi:hypothetical protein